MNGPKHGAASVVRPLLTPNGIENETLLTTREAAALAGVTPASWRSYVSRGNAPQPDGRLGITPWWQESTIRRWQKSRPGQGAGGGRPVTAGDVA